VKKYICDNPENLQSHGVELYSWRGNGIPDWCTDIRGACLCYQKTVDSWSVFSWIIDTDFLCAPKTTGQQLPELEEVCTITADISGIRPSQLRGPKGPFQRYEFNFSLFFEGAKMKARLEWMEGVRALF
jgi:hypothetical protein